MLRIHRAVPKKAAVKVASQNGQVKTAIKEYWWARQDLNLEPTDVNGAC